MRIVNKKALHNYHILEHFEAGIVLTGAEVKSIKAGRIEMAEAYVKIVGNEVYLLNANIPKPIQVAIRDYDQVRSRKLLLHRGQIASLIGKVSKSGATLVPVSMYTKGGRLKLDIGLAKSKKQFDKRKVIKERDHLRRIEQELRGKE